MEITKWLYQNLGVPLVLAYFFLLARPVEDELVSRGICKVGNDLCTGGFGLLIFIGIITVIGLSADLLAKAFHTNDLAIGTGKKSDILVDNVHFRNESSMGIVSYLDLKVENKSKSEITECYGTLQHLEPLFIIEDDQSGEQFSKKVTLNIRRVFGELSRIPLSWKMLDQNERVCKISISPHTSEMLRIAYGISWRQNDDPTFHNSFDLARCVDDASGFPLGGPSGLPLGLYKITVRVDGKRDGKSINPAYFKGYFYRGVPQSATPPFPGGPIPDLVMFIRQGNPMKDKDIPSYLKN